MPRVMHTTQTFENLLLAIQEKGLKVKTAKAGVAFDIDSDIEAVILALILKNMRILTIILLF